MRPDDYVVYSHLAIAKSCRLQLVGFSLSRSLCPRPDHRAVMTQAGQNSVRVAAMQILYEDMKRAIQQATRSQYTVHVLDAIFSKPVFRSSDLAEQLHREYGVHEKTAQGLLRQIRNAGILLELQSGSGRRPAILCFPRLINLAEGREVL